MADCCAAMRPICRILADRAGSNLWLPADLPLRVRRWQLQPHQPHAMCRRGKRHGSSRSGGYTPTKVCHYSASAQRPRSAFTPGRGFTPSPPFDASIRSATLSERFESADDSRNWSSALSHQARAAIKIVSALSPATEAGSRPGRRGTFFRPTTRCFAKR